MLDKDKSGTIDMKDVEAWVAAEADEIEVSQCMAMLLAIAYKQPPSRRRLQVAELMRLLPLLACSAPGSELYPQLRPLPGGGAE